MLSDDWREPRRLHPLSPVVTVARNPIGVGFAAALAVTTGDVIFVIALAAMAAGAVIGHLRRQWWFDGSTLHLRSGLLAIHERSLAADRVQQVDLREPLVARMLGLSVVAVESASGSAGSDIELGSLEVDEARRLRQAILAARAVEAEAGEPRVGPSPADLDAEMDDAFAEPAPVATLPFSELVLAGVIGAESMAGGMAAAAGAVFFGLDLIGSDPDRFTITGPAMAAALFVAFLAVAVVAAVASMVLGYAEFSVTKRHGEIRLRRGLLERREESTPVRRVQVITLTETPPQRALGRVAIRLRSAGTPGKESAGRLRIPLWCRVDTARLLEELAPGVGRTADAELEPAPRAARRRAIVRRALVLSLPLAALLAAAAAANPWWAIPAGLLLATAVPWGLAAYRALGLARSAGVVVARRGALIRRTDLTPEAKVQSTRVRSTPFQRRVGLATLHLDVAGTDAVRVLDRAASEAAALGAQLGSQALAPT